MLNRYRGKSTVAVTMMLIRDLKKKRPIPVCAKCDKPVDDFTLDTTMDDCYFHFTAYCHGKQQAFSVHKGLFMFAEDVEVGKAFESEMPKLIDYDRRLLDGHPRIEN